MASLSVRVLTHSSRSVWKNSLRAASRLPRWGEEESSANATAGRRVEPYPLHPMCKKDRHQSVVQVCSCTGERGSDISGCKYQNRARRDRREWVSADRPSVRTSFGPEGRQRRCKALRRQLSNADTLAGSIYKISNGYAEELTAR